MNLSCIARIYAVRHAIRQILEPTPFKPRQSTAARTSNDVIRVRIVNGKTVLR